LKGNYEFPCSDCGGFFDRWEPKEEQIATGAALPRNDNEEDAVDMVNRPPHYTHGQYECIDVMVDTFGKEAVQHFCLLNAFKYVWRSEHKNGIEDVKKAWWYLDKYLQLEVEKHD
jgi:hypothetical protein